MMFSSFWAQRLVQAFRVAPPTPAIFAQGVHKMMKTKGAALKRMSKELYPSPCFGKRSLESADNKGSERKKNEKRGRILLKTLRSCLPRRSRDNISRVNRVAADAGG